MSLLAWEYSRRGEFQGYETSKKLSNGSVAWFGAQEYESPGGRDTQWAIEIEVYRKRKHRNLESLQLTGPGGLEAPGFFLEALADFENWFAQSGDRIHVAGADGRRYRVYEKVLTRRGYFPTRFGGYPYLVKVMKEEA